MQHPYEDLLARIFWHGEMRTDRTGTGTKSLFGPQIEFDLAGNVLPLVTTKTVYTKAIIHELLWMLSGSTSVLDLQKHGVTIWDEWADADGDLGPVYGKQWRSWTKPVWNEYDEITTQPIDQIAEVVELLRKSPDTRRAVVSAWNPADVPDMRLPPCHMIFQFHVSSRRELSCKLFMRSADMFLGVPFNIASYAMLTMMMAQVLNLSPGKLIITFGDAHIYQNHFDQVRIQLQRDPREFPRLRLNPDIQDIFGFTYEDFDIMGYDPHPSIRGDVAV